MILRTDKFLNSMVDKSIQNKKNEGHNEGVTFINNCVKEVCLNNDELIKYYRHDNKVFKRRNA